MKDTQRDFVKRRLEEITGQKIKSVTMNEETKTMEIVFR